MLFFRLIINFIDVPLEVILTATIMPALYNVRVLTLRLLPTKSDMAATKIVLYRWIHTIAFRLV